MSDLDLEQRPSRRLWICAAVTALALHVGGAALALANLRGDDVGDGLGANAAEFAVEMASPKVEDENLPPGPDADASQAAPQLSEQKAEVKETDLPKDVPIESEDPDRIVTQNDSKKPQEDDPKVQAVQTQASEEAPAQEATARQTLEENAPEAEQAKAPNRGIGKDRQKLTADWGRKISAYFELHKRYPHNKSKATTVKVSIVLNRRGNIVNVAVAESSGDQAFDDAAISMVRRSDPVPAPPAELTEDQFAFSLDVNFKKPK
ncbi:TonB family protein [Bradyrhizobium sp. Leo170]|uniref:TonB family protein n=1 Tax=Bradyrhizobium sp. Leo170 TaxID=1571199 RepID=UPI00102E502D|nr:TonB family protein [Bradyrhizobium sp. Leo170]TAI61453.1 energy transducer TonB [Bradyrhizobium sp. Leo170]